MKTIFMSVNKNIQEVNVIKEDDKYYYLDSNLLEKVNKSLNSMYTLSNDDEVFVDETKEGLIKKYNKEIEDKINILENKIMKLKRKLMT